MTHVLYSKPTQARRGSQVSAREVGLARRVQARLLPGRAFAEGTLQAAGFSQAALGIGGDFFDFIPYAPGRLAIAIGDACGKGLPAALIATALHAALRSHYALASGDLVSRVRSLNRLLHDSTAPEHYVTLFIGEFDAASSTLCYANCGHATPIVSRYTGSVERVAPTGTPLGLFGGWLGGTAKLALSPGDVLLLVTDGISELVDASNTPVGEARLLASLQARRSWPVDRLARALVEDALALSARKGRDDATVVVARRRAQ